ncbi:MAG: carboxypeptidase-like regulatory domain-containing protein [Muribaculaceae bacterium]|nr:carboxypeptidase-like regulatory domain-containing protein [Muribaculaceae bacterium]
MKRFFTLLVILCVMASVNAHAAVIKGVVTDVEGQPMAFTTVWVEDINRTTVSGLDGSYTLRDVPAGMHQVYATYIGHKKEIASVDVTGEVATCDFVLDESTQVLPELFVTPAGESIELFIMRMVAVHKKSLKDVVASYDCRGSIYWEADNDSTVYNMPSWMYKIVKFELSLFKLGKLCEIERNYPGLKFVLDKKLTFDGKIKGDKQAVVEMRPTLKQDEVDYLQNHSWKIDENFYDDTYKKFDVGKVRKMREKSAKAEQKALAKGEEAEEDTTAVKYVGKYEEDDRDIYILKHGKYEYHIVDELWQVKRMCVKDKYDERIYEFRELLPGVFLPVSYYQKVLFDMDLKNVYAKELEEMKAKDRSKMTDKDKQKLDEDIAKRERFVNHRYWNMQRCFTWDYENLVPANTKK